MSAYQGKRILFFYNKYMGYERIIEEELLDMGFQVDAFDERPIDKTHQKVIRKICPGFFNKKTELYYSEILNKIKHNYYDIVFFIKCDMPTPNALKGFREAFPNAKFCLYMWDSLNNYPDTREKFKYFDVINTFDRKDSIDEKIGFRPLFYAKQYEQKVDKDKNHKYDFCFIGTIHSDRFEMLQKVKTEAKKNNQSVFFYPYLQKKYVFYAYKILKPGFRNANINDFKFEKISGDKIAEVVSESKAVIDVQHPKQTGLTMRTIEMIGMNKKLITTNEDIKNYDFYNPTNICVVDRKNPVIEKEFFEVPYKELPEDIYRKYNLTQWVIDALDLEGESK